MKILTSHSTRATTAWSLFFAFAGILCIDHIDLSLWFLIPTALFLILALREAFDEV